MKTGIIGGGITGLTLGCLIEDCTILEKDSRIGGLCRSLEENGFTFDTGGSHIIFSRDQEVMNFLVSTLEENVVKNRRNTKILFKDRFIKYPFENGLEALPKEDNYECLHGYIDCQLKKARNELEKPSNFKEWMYYTFGKGITEKYLLPYNEKIWNYKAEHMSLDWVNGRVPEPPIEDVIKSSLGITTEGYVHQLYFYYPATGGIEALVKGIGKRSRGELIKSFKVSSITKENEKWIVADEKRELVFDQLISTIPLQELVKLLRDVPTEVVEAIKNLKFNSLITIMIGVDNPTLNDISWLYVPGPEDGLFNRISFPSNFSNKVTPRGCSSVLVEITCTPGNEIWQRDDEDLILETIDDLHGLKILNKNEICYSKASRSQYAYVVYDLNYTENMKIITEYFSSTGLQLCGRFSEFKYMNMDACVRSAFDLAQKINEKKQEAM